MPSTDEGMLRGALTSASPGFHLSEVCVREGVRQGVPASPRGRERGAVGRGTLKRYVESSPHSRQFMMTLSRPARLRLLGSPSLELPDGTPASGRPAQRHRIALLALLSLVPDRRMSRDKLMGWLWPDVDGPRARNLLSVSIHVLRDALGRSAIVSHGDDIRLDDALVRSDVSEFEAAVAGGNPDAAVAIYSGPFLDGFFLPDAEAFDQWSGRERERLAGLYRKSLAGMAEAAEAAGDFRVAIERWRACAAFDPLDSEIALRLMGALEASGNRAGAIQHAAVHERLLDEELGTTAPEVAAKAEQLRTDPAPRSDIPPRAARRAGAREPLAELPDDGGQPAELPEPAERRPRSRRIPVAVFAVLALALVSWSLWQGPRPAPSLVVLPFADLTPGAASNPLGDGLTDEIIAGLATVPGLTVIAPESAERYGSSVASLPEIARELAVAHVLHGTVKRNGGQLRVTARLVQAERERVLWARSYDASVDGIAPVLDAIAHDVVRALEVRLVGDSTRTLVRRQTRNPEAYALYQQGRFHWARRTIEGHRQAHAYFQRALALDSGYADAYAGLADAHLTGWHHGATALSEEEVRVQMTRAAERALSLDPASADAHTSFAMSLWWQKNWPGAERELRRAVELTPGHARARNWLAQLIAAMGREDEALQEARRAAELDPFAVVMVKSWGWHCYLVRDWSCAVEQLDRSLELDPQYVQAIRYLAMAEAMRGRHVEAEAAMRRVLGLVPEAGYAQAELAIVQARAGDSTAARASLQRAIGRTSAFDLARAWTALGERDSAFAALERYDDWKWPHRGLLADPIFDPVRGDARFAALEERVLREMAVR